MTLKDLFTLLEKENKLHAYFKEPIECFCIVLNDYYGSNKEFTTFKQFTKYIKSEWIEEYCETLLSLNIVLDEHNKMKFTSFDRWGRPETDNSIEIYKYQMR